MGKDSDPETPLGIRRVARHHPACRASFLPTRNGNRLTEGSGPAIPRTERTMRRAGGIGARVIGRGPDVGAQDVARLRFHRKPSALLNVDADDARRRAKRGDFGSNLSLSLLGGEIKPWAAACRSQCVGSARQFHFVPSQPFFEISKMIPSGSLNFRSKFSFS